MGIGFIHSKDNAGQGLFWKMIYLVRDHELKTRASGEHLKATAPISLLGSLESCQWCRKRMAQ
jgi:hypothetical protein